MARQFLTKKSRMNPEILKILNWWLNQTNKPRYFLNQYRNLNLNYNNFTTNNKMMDIITSKITQTKIFLIIIRIILTLKKISIYTIVKLHKGIFTEIQSMILRNKEDTLQITHRIPKTIIQINNFWWVQVQ
jgi:hypothetical protein